MDIREERYSDFIAMLLVSILLLGLTLFELAILLSRNSQG
jgi:Tfp pilus assembly protein PilV